MEFYKDIDRCRDIIDENLKEALDMKLEYQKEIIESMSYSLFTGGKRIRPILTLKSYELFSGNKDYSEVINEAMAIEMIHTYSLIHDDLPAMDDDKYRRGMLTNHVKYGEAMAILAGDGLLNLAFEISLENLLEKPNIHRHIKALKVIANKSGVHGMIGGQVIDLHTNIKEYDEKKISYMYKTKTGGLITAAILSGAIIGGANSEELKIMSDFSLSLGLAYQIKDDILDIEEDSKINKPTYLSVLGKDKGLRKLERLKNESILNLEKLKNKDIKFLKELTEALYNRDV